MKQWRTDGVGDRLILRGLLKDVVVCSRIASQWNGGLFDSQDANLLASWCIDFYKKYGSPPDGQIGSVFEEWVRLSNPSEERVIALRRLIEEVQSGEPLNSDYLLDYAGKYFNRVYLERELDLAREELDSGRVDLAYERLSQLKKVQLGVDAVVKPSEDYSAWWEALEEERHEPLVLYPGELFHFLSRWLVRDSLFSFMGPDKSGKSMWLLDLAFRAVKAKRRVAYFELGDMGKNGVLERLACRCTGLPLSRFRGKNCNYVRWPVKVNDDGEVVFQNKEISKKLTPSAAFRSFRSLCRGRDLFRLVCYPNSTLGVSGLRGILADWEREGWVPDVVAIDYADILAPPEGVKDVLEQIDYNWRHLRRLSQELHCLVVTATQSNALAYRTKNELLGKKHFSGRKTKLAHVNGMIGINVSPSDREANVTRLNWVVRRSGYFNDRDFAIAAGCWEVMNPAVRARGVLEEEEYLEAFGEVLV